MRQWKRILSVILVSVLAAGSFCVTAPVKAYAAELQYAEIWNSDKTFSSDQVVEGRVLVDGNVTLTIEDGVTLTVKNGITVPIFNTLTIEGGGTLISTATDEGCAGIGGDSNNGMAGYIIINSGTVNATGGEKAAGIGGGDGGHGGDTTINGGTVTADTAKHGGGAGIGGGRGGTGGHITINGGTVTANDNSTSDGTLSYFDKGAAIGAGAGVGRYYVEINGGTVVANNDVGATNSAGSAAIGCGTDARASGTILITGGQITVTNGNVGANAWDLVENRSTIELSWKYFSDRIDMNGFNFYTKTLKVNEYFLDNEGNVFEPQTVDLSYGSGNNPGSYGHRTWLPGVRNVNFYSDEDTLFESVKVTIAKTVSAPASDPEWQYGTFYGWFDSYHDQNADSATDAFDFTKTIMEDTNVYAGWTWSPNSIDDYGGQEDPSMVPAPAPGTTDEGDQAGGDATNEENEKDDKKPSKGVDTGDDASLTAWLTLMLTSIAGLLASVFTRRRSDRK